MAGVPSGSTATRLRAPSAAWCALVWLLVIGGPPLDVLTDVSSLRSRGLEVADRHLNFYDSRDNLADGSDLLWCPDATLCARDTAGVSRDLREPVG